VGYLAVVQEGTTNEPSTSPIFLPFSSTVNPRVEMRFTGAGMAAESFGRRYVLDSYTSVPAVWSMRDCALWNVVFLNDSPNAGHNFSFANNRWLRGHLSLDHDMGPAYSLGLHNNLWLGGRVFLNSYSAGGLWTLYDNLFDVTTNSAPAGTSWTAADNAYRSATTFGGISNVTVTVAEHLTGPLGTNYYPSANGAGGGFTQLLGAGFRTGPVAGLFHHVIATNLVPVGTGAVGIGFHHLRTTAAGVPLDTDGDGIPDWMEDVNGDGSATGDPSSWTTYTSAHGIVTGGLSLFSPLK